MDCLKHLENASNAVLAITKSSNEHILAFYCNTSKEGFPTIEPKWVLRENSIVTSVHDLTFFQKMALNVELVEDEATQRPIVTFGLPITDDRKLFLVKSPPGSHGNAYAVLFKGQDGQFCRMEDIYVDLTTSNQTDAALAKCYIKYYSPAGVQGVETLDVNLGPISKFFIK